MTCVDDAIHDLNLLLLITSIISRFVINWRLRDNVKPKTLHKIKLDNPLSSVKLLLGKPTNANKEYTLLHKAFHHRTYSGRKRSSQGSEAGSSIETEKEH